MAELARFTQLREFSLAMPAIAVWTDWSDPALFAAFTACCLPNLRHLQLHGARLSEASMAAIASAVPQLRTFDFSRCELSCHPAVVCAVLGGYCEHIERVSGRGKRRHEWRGVQAADIIAAYESAVASAGRGDGYRPFTQLRDLCIDMCWCTPPPVWHAFLSLLRHAAHLLCVAKLVSDDPLSFSALSYLPSLALLGSSCLWPLSFAQLMERRSELSGRYYYLASQEVGGEECVAPATLELTAEAVRQSIRLRPNSDLFVALQRSLSADHQATLARWTAGNFHRSDAYLTAVNTNASKRQGCSRPQNLHNRYEVAH